MLNSNLLRKLDMQDLMVFVHVYERSSVTEVSEELCVSQSTVSYCLKKLRTSFGDELFMNTRTGMIPTAKGSTIYPHILSILNSINLCHSGIATFNPEKDKTIFNIHAPEYFEILILPKLLKMFADNDLPIIVNVDKFGQDIPVEEMKSGAIDLVICFGPNFHRSHIGLQSCTLLEDDLLCVADTGAAPDDGLIDLDTFIARRHVYPTPWTSSTNMVDGWLSRQGLSREIVARANSYGSAVRLLKGTDFLLALPKRIAAQLCTASWLTCCTPPQGLPSFTLNMVWSDRLERDAGNTWLREQIMKICSDEGMI